MEVDNRNTRRTQRFPETVVPTEQVVEATREAVDRKGRIWEVQEAVIMELEVMDMAMVVVVVEDMVVVVEMVEDTVEDTVVAVVDMVVELTKVREAKVRVLEVRDLKLEQTKELMEAKFLQVLESIKGQIKELVELIKDKQVRESVQLITKALETMEALDHMEQTKELVVIKELVQLVDKPVLALELTKASEDREVLVHTMEQIKVLVEARFLLELIKEMPLAGRV